MQDPIALKLLDGREPKVHRVSINATVGKALRGRPSSLNPAVVVATEVSVLAAQSAGLVDGSSVIAVVDGDWSDAILIVVPQKTALAVNVSQSRGGDESFLASVASNAPHLSELAEKTVAALRAGDVEGELVEEGSGRWVNRPINSLTLKAQPRAGNIAFTIYGNPNTFDAGDFLRRDQNSYSRGWVSSEAEIDEFVRLAQLSQMRRAG